MSTAHSVPSGLTSETRSSWPVRTSSGPAVVVAPNVLVPSPARTLHPPWAQSEPVTASMVGTVSPGIGTLASATGSALPLSSTWTCPSRSTHAARWSSELMVRAL